MQSSKKKWKRWIYLDKRERNAMLVFAVVLCIINIGGTYLSYQKEKEIMIIKQEIPVSDSDHHRRHKSQQEEQSNTTRSRANLERETIKSKRSTREKGNKTVEDTKKMLTHPPKLALEKDYILDPNSAGPSELEKLGLSEGQIQNLINYRNKVGLFVNKEELKKLYTLNEEDYTRIAPHLKISTPNIGTVKKTSAEAPKVAQRVLDINSATAQDWEELKGIGPYYAGKIVRYREKLGGFTHVDQIKETWDVPPEVIEDNRKYLKLETAVEVIDIQQADFKTLIQHPYINKRQTKLLLKLQGKNLIIDEEIMKDIFNEEEWSRVSQYLSW